MAAQATQSLEDCFPAHRRDGCGEGQMDGEERHLEVRRQERHQVVAAVPLEAAGDGQVVGMAAKVGPSVAGDGDLAHRRGDEGVRGAATGQLEPQVQRLQSAHRIGRSRISRLHLAAVRQRIDHRDAVGAR